MFIYPCPSKVDTVEEVEVDEAALCIISISRVQRIDFTHRVVLAAVDVLSRVASLSNSKGIAEQSTEDTAEAIAFAAVHITVVVAVDAARAAGVVVVNVRGRDSEGDSGQDDSSENLHFDGREEMVVKKTIFKYAG